jgi:hypothetical protein
MVGVDGAHHSQNYSALAAERCQLTDRLHFLLSHRRPLVEPACRGGRRSGGLCASPPSPAALRTFPSAASICRFFAPLHAASNASAHHVIPVELRRLLRSAYFCAFPCPLEARVPLNPFCSAYPARAGWAGSQHTRRPRRLQPPPRSLTSDRRARAAEPCGFFPGC